MNGGCVPRPGGGDSSDNGGSAPSTGRSDVQAPHPPHSSHPAPSGAGTVVPPGDPGAAESLDVAARLAGDHVALLDAVDAAVLAFDPDDRLIAWNGGAERMLGWTRTCAIGQHVLDRLAPQGRTAQLRMLLERARDHAGFEGQVDLATRAGDVVPVELRLRPLDATSAPGTMVGVAVDVTERLAMERRVTRANAHLAAVTDHMGEGLCTLDADGCITLLNHHGAELLGATEAEATGTSFPARLAQAGAPGLGEPGDITTLLDDLRHGRLAHDQTAGQPVTDLLFRADGGRIPIEYVATPLPSGAARPPQSAVVIFRDITERRARERELREEAKHASTLRMIDRALAEDRFVLHAQPVVRLADRAIVQHELLIRLEDPDHGLLSPARFLPTAERYGLIGAIDRWVVGEAVGLAARGWTVHVNVSARSMDDDSFAPYVDQQLFAASADPSRLVFELTETAMLDDLGRARRFADQIRAVGARLALDDFGTGYSGFVYLKSLPVDVLKIDREFVADAVDNDASRHVIGAVVALAGAFGLTTVAEGVEDEATAQLLEELGVQHAQGYHLGRPSPLVAPGSADVPVLTEAQLRAATGDAT